MKQIEIHHGVKLEELLRQAKCKDVVLTESGHAVALLSDFSDDDLHWYSRERDAALVASLVRAREQVAQGQVMKHEDVKKHLGIE